MDLWREKYFEGRSKEDQAKVAIATTLHLIRTNAVLGYHLNIGSKAFGQLTEAAATLFGESVEDVRKRFAHPKAVDPSEALRRIIEIVEGDNPPTCGKYPCGKCVWCVAMEALETCR